MADLTDPRAIKLKGILFLVLGIRGSSIGYPAKSITNTEYDRARERSLVILPFVKKSVFATLRGFQSTPDAGFSSIVDDTSIFRFVEQVESAKADNWLHQYEDVEGIKAG